MKKSKLNKLIKNRIKIYYDACDKINERFDKEIKKLDDFRAFCITKILNLMSKDRTLLKYRKLKEKIK